MTPPVFVDTSAWFALFVPSDAYHAAAERFLQQNTESFLTTDYVLDETLTLLKGRGELKRALQLGKDVFAGTLATLHYLDGDDIAAAWSVFRNFHDKDWSFTDCTSKVVIEKLGLTTAFAFDHHFTQFGTVIVVP